MVGFHFQIEQNFPIKRRKWIMAKLILAIEQYHSLSSMFKYKDAFSTQVQKWVQELHQLSDYSHYKATSTEIFIDKEARIQKPKRIKAITERYCQHWNWSEVDTRYFSFGAKFRATF